MKQIILISLLLFTSACGLDIEGNDTKQQDLVEREKLNVEYTPAVGTYKGIVTNTSRPQDPVNEIKLFIKEEVKGTDNYGNPRVFPSLKGYWRSFDQDGQELVGVPLTAQYIQESSVIILVSENKSMGIFSMNGTLINGVIEGEIYLGRGFYGNFTGYLQDEK